MQSPITSNLWKQAANDGCRNGRLAHDSTSLVFILETTGDVLPLYFETDVLDVPLVLLQSGPAAQPTNQESHVVLLHAWRLNLLFGAITSEPGRHVFLRAV